jgi:hypothetical protein
VRLAANLLNAATANEKCMIANMQQGDSARVETFHDQSTIRDE